MRSVVVALLALVTLSFGACAVDDGEPVTEHDEPADYDPVPADGKADGVPAVFDQHDVMGDDTFTEDRVTVAEMQRFLERSPYNNRSWLADYRIGDKSGAQLVVEAARGAGINPIVLLARMQVESSAVSKTVRPSQATLDKALGCGCPDGRACSSAYRGFQAQLSCGAQILRKWYDASKDSTGQWRKGVTRKTLDPKSVTPKNHATASLYAYTPWVLVGRGGNWLVWNVTRKYVRHAEATGILADEED